MAKRAWAATSFRDKLFYGINGTVLSLFFILTLYPVIYLISSSVSAPEAVAMGRVVLWPVGFSLKGFEAIFRHKFILAGYTNSFIYTIVGIALSVSVTLLTAFPLSRKELVGRSSLSMFFAFTMWFSGGLIPTYLLIRDLGLMNTRWVMWLPGMVGVWNIIICRTFFANSIPDELFDSASIDGCGYYLYFWHIVLPLSGAVVAVIALFVGVGYWNAYFSAFIYLNDRALMPLQIFLREILIQNAVDAEVIVDSGTSMANVGLVELLKYSLIMAACVPLWIIYPFVQKSFVKGVMIGSIKG